MKKTFAIISSLLLLLSCSKERMKNDENNIDLRVTHSEVAFSYKGGSFPVTIKTSGAWTLVSDASWLVASETSADYGKTIFLNAKENGGGESRECCVRISNMLGYREIHITQSKDSRNFTDIYLSSDPYGFRKMDGVKLVIPYRNGEGRTMGPISVDVAGSAKGSISVDTLDVVKLEDGSGRIELGIHGRAGEKGTLLFTVSGLPATVFGDASQCMVDVQASSPAQELSISSLRKKTLGEIDGFAIIAGTVISDKASGTFPDNVFILQDAMTKQSGICVRCPEAHSFNPGDVVEIFLDGASLVSDNSLLVLDIPANDDVSLDADGSIPEPVLLALPSDLENYESMLCTMEMVQAADDEVSRSDFSGSVKMDKYACEDGFLLYAPVHSAIASLPFLSGSGSVSGIVGRDADGNAAIVPQSLEDIAMLNGQRINMHAVFRTDTDFIHNIAAAGESGIGFSLTSSIDWTLKTDAEWITSISKKSGTGSQSASAITFSASPNTGARRRGTITISAAGVPDIEIIVIQLEGNRILDADFSEVLSQTYKVFPQSAGTDYALMLDRIGLSGWFATNCYLSASPDLKYGLIRVGKTYTKGNIVTPPFTAIGDTPVNVEITFLAGIQSGCTLSWFGIDLDNTPGEILEGQDVLRLEAYDETYTSTFVDMLPVNLVTGLGTSALKRVTVKVSGATKDTKLKMTATCKGGSSASSCDLFVIGDLHVNYID